MKLADSAGRSPRRSPPRRALTTLLSLAIGLIPAVSAAQSEAPGGGLNLIRDTEIEETLRADADGVFRAAGLDPKAVQIHVIGEKEINAFVAGGQHLFLYTGLIEETKSPNQLVGVMAHETGHMAGGHLVRSGDMTRAGLGPTAVALGLGVLAALAGQGGAAVGLMSSSTYFGTLNVLTYSREQESRADQAGLTYLEGAHLSGYGLVKFFDNFRYQEVFDASRRFPFFRSHPLSSDRIEALRQRAELQPSYNVVDTPEAIARHEIMVAKLYGFLETPLHTRTRYVEGDRSYPARYARAIADFRDAQAPKALNEIGELIDEQADNPYLWELKGQVLFETADMTGAVEAYGRSVALKPDAPLLRINLAQALLGDKMGANADAAIAELRRATSAEPDNGFAWRLMAQAYDAKGEPGEARLAAAEEKFADGDEAQARGFAVRARDLLPKGGPDWRRATDIILASHPDRADLKAAGD
jgi:predicted Zn-dependent protease